MAGRGWNNESTSERRFCFLRLAKWEVGLPASASAAYDPFQVARLFAFWLGREEVRCRHVPDGWEKGRMVVEVDDGERCLSGSANVWRTGEGGAYISARWVREAGSVRAESSCLTLSHCVWVVCRDDWSAIRNAEEGACGLVGP